MKRILLLTLVVIFGIYFNGLAQTASKDLNIEGSTYRINSIIPLGKFRLWIVVNNTSQFDYRDVVYKVEYIAGDGTVEGSDNYIMHDYVSPGMSKKLKEQFNLPERL